jgi:hypothetical protein
MLGQARAPSLVSTPPGRSGLAPRPAMRCPTSENSLVDTLAADPRAISSAGRAPPRQGGGHWFEPSIAHGRSACKSLGFGARDGRRGSNMVPFVPCSPLRRQVHVRLQSSAANLRLRGPRRGRGALQVADLESGLRLLKLLNDDVAVALGVVALEAEQASRVVAEAFSEFNQRRA